MDWEMGNLEPAPYGGAIPASHNIPTNMAYTGYQMSNEGLPEGSAFQ